jgi:hypothetical protein
LTSNADRLDSATRIMRKLGANGSGNAVPNFSTLHAQWPLSRVDASIRQALSPADGLAATITSEQNQRSDVDRRINAVLNRLEISEQRYLLTSNVAFQTNQVERQKSINRSLYALQQEIMTSRTTDTGYNGRSDVSDEDISCQATSSSLENVDHFSVERHREFLRLQGLDVNARPFEMPTTEPIDEYWTQEMGGQQCQNSAPSWSDGVEYNPEAGYQDCFRQGIQSNSKRYHSVDTNRGCQTPYRTDIESDDKRTSFDNKQVRSKIQTRTRNCLVLL